MRKIGLLLIIVLIGIRLEAQIVNIPDSNFKTCLLNDIWINTNQDNEIQVSEAINSTSIGCANLNITDLTGIEAFTSLTDLSCYNNLLTSLDISSNTNLINLDFSNNLINSIDVSAHPSLRSLSCGENQLTILDVSANTLLESLVCRNNQIDSLDISTNSALVILIAEDNLLFYLNGANGNNTNFGYFDVNHNSNLNCIYVDDASYSTTNWHNIDTNSSFYDAQNTCGTLSLSTQLSNLNISFYPNPTNGIISIRGNEMIEIRAITISNSFGQNIRVLKSLNEIDLSNFSNGIYHIQFEVEGGNKIIQKIIKE